MLVENLSKSTKNTISFVARRVLPVAMSVSSIGCGLSDILINRTSQPSSRGLQEICTNNLILSAHYFKDFGGEVSSDGNPKFQVNIDEIVGPIAERKYLVTSIGGFSPSIFITGADGKVDRVVSEFGSESLTGKGVPLVGTVFIAGQNLRITKVMIEGLDGKSKKHYDIPCDSTVEIAVKVPENKKEFDDFPDSMEIK